ncbi:MAG: hypothetical protein JOZ62_11440 [Acidobacteriaceae bacterium]|nr:hypothetical protein [Acidobacteriaceae bacterium]
MLTFSSVAVAAALLFSSFATSPAKAAIKLPVSNDGNHFYTGANILGGTGGYFTFSNFTLSTLAFGRQDNNSLNLSSFNVSSTGKGTLYLELSGNNYTGQPGQTYLLGDQVAATYTGGGDKTPIVDSITVRGYEDNQNYLFANSKGTPSLTGIDRSAVAAPVLRLNGFGAASNYSGPYNFTAPYSRTQIATMHFSGTGTTTVQFASNLASPATPEPASVLLCGTVLIALGVYGRKRMGARNEDKN